MALRYFVVAGSNTSETNEVTTLTLFHWQGSISRAVERFLHCSPEPLLFVGRYPHFLNQGVKINGNASPVAWRFDATSVVIVFVLIGQKQSKLLFSTKPPSLSKGGAVRYCLKLRHSLRAVSSILNSGQEEFVVDRRLNRRHQLVLCGANRYAIVRGVCGPHQLRFLVVNCPTTYTTFPCVFVCPLMEIALFAGTSLERVTKAFQTSKPKLSTLQDC